MNIVILSFKVKVKNGKQKIINMMEGLMLMESQSIIKPSVGRKHMYKRKL